MPKCDNWGIETVFHIGNHLLISKVAYYCPLLGHAPRVVIQENSLLVTVTITASVNFMKNIAQKVNELTHSMVGFFHPPGVRVLGNSAENCKKPDAVWGRISPFFGGFWAGLGVLSGFGKFRFFASISEIPVFPEFERKVIPEK